VVLLPKPKTKQVMKRPRIISCVLKRVGTSANRTAKWKVNKLLFIKVTDKTFNSTYCNDNNHYASEFF